MSRKNTRTLIGGAPEGFDALFIAALAEGGQDVMVVARDDVHMARKAEAVAFFAPILQCLEFPAWDCLPYDRVSPRGQLVNRRIDTLARLAEDKQPKKAGRIILTTVSAMLQRVPPRQGFADSALTLEVGKRLDPGELDQFLLANGYFRSDTVMEPGEFAKRGGIVDIFPAGAEAPLRLDFFGDELEGLRAFDAATQRTTETRTSTVLRPVSEVLLDEASITRFRSGYRVLFAKAGDDDPLYGAVSSGHRHIGMEHWLPLFHERVETLLDYLPGAQVVLDHRAEEARDARLELIAEYYLTRRGFVDTKPKGGLAQVGAVYHPVPPEAMFLDAREWDDLLGGHAVHLLSPFAAPESTGVTDVGGRGGHDFADIRVRPDANVFDALGDHVHDCHSEGRRVVLTAFSQGSRDRLVSMLNDHGLENLVPADTWAEAINLDAKLVAICVVGLEHGFVAPGPDGGLAVITEPDILGERMTRPSKARVRPENFIAEASALSSGDLVVHVEHGIGRFEGLQTIEVGGAPHDCLKLVYGGGDKLFLPVENIDVITRFGSEEAGANLDRLGGAAWQSRKARMKGRIRDMAEELIRIAAARELQGTKRITVEQGLYDEFSARFAFTETDDQARAIDDTLKDLAGNRSMDRLICGDVGFGKTEVALRAAFATV
ncbi:MAG: transcription-repair coupling factor, partial [Rhodospirillales bacterium]|nr:transcription-repair coupling factor [Rhodospirillales bacterium]